MKIALCTYSFLLKTSTYLKAIIGFFYDAQTNQENGEEEGGVVDKETERTMFMKNSFHFCIQYTFEKIHAEFEYLIFLNTDLQSDNKTHLHILQDLYLFLNKLCIEKDSPTVETSENLES